MTSCAILFDLDGTLVDTIQDLADAANRTIREIGLPALPAEDTVCCRRRCPQPDGALLPGRGNAD